MGMIKLKLYQLVNYPQVENVHYVLAKYLLENTNNINRLSLNKVVGDTFVSKSSVLKFCQYLGFDSWRHFCGELQDELLIDQQHLARLKMNAKLVYIKENNDDYLKLKDEFFKEVEVNLSYSKIKKFAQELHDYDKIIIIGDIREVYLFCELQYLLSFYGKIVILPRYLNQEDLNRQISSIDNDTLVVIINSLYSYEDFIEQQLLESMYKYNHSLIMEHKKIFIGQKSKTENDNLITFTLPFSFNEYFIRLAILDLIYKTITYYSHKY